MGTASKHIQYTYADQYPTLIGYGALGEKVNRRIKQYWMDTGQTLDVQEVIIDVLTDDYNERHSDPQQSTSPDGSAE